jgi:hypothetical protein
MTTCSLENNTEDLEEFSDLFDMEHTNIDNTCVLILNVNPTANLLSYLTNTNVWSDLSYQIVRRHDCVITKVTKDSFIIQKLNPEENEDSDVTLTKDVISESDHALITVGRQIKYYLCKSYVDMELFSFFSFISRKGK